MNAQQHAYAVGQDVFVRGGFNRTARPDKIVRETATRWICASGKWFDKQTNRGPRPKSNFASPEYLEPGNDPVVLHEIATERLQAAAFKFERLVKAERVVDTAAARAAIAEMLKLLDALDGGAA